IRALRNVDQLRQLVGLLGVDRDPLVSRRSTAVRLDELLLVLAEVRRRPRLECGRRRLVRAEGNAEGETDRDPHQPTRMDEFGVHLRSRYPVAWARLSVAAGA